MIAGGEFLRPEQVDALVDGNAEAVGIPAAYEPVARVLMRARQSLEPGQPQHLEAVLLAFRHAGRRHELESMVRRVLRLDRNADSRFGLAAGGAG